jgi:hypothetical protein
MKTLKEIFLGFEEKQKAVIYILFGMILGCFYLRILELILI